MEKLQFWKCTIDFIASIFNSSKYLVKKACKWKLHSVGTEFQLKTKSQIRYMQMWTLPRLSFQKRFSVTCSLWHGKTEIWWWRNQDPTPMFFWQPNVVMLLLHIFRDAVRVNLKPCLKEHSLDYCSNWNQHRGVGFLAWFLSSSKSSKPLPER